MFSIFYFYFCILYFCIVFVLLYVLFLLLCSLFPIFVRVYRPLLPVGNPIAVNKYYVMKRWSRISVFVAAARLRLVYLTNCSTVLDRGKNFFSFPKCPGWLWVLTKPGLFPGCKAAEPPTSAEVKDEWSSHSIPSNAFLESTKKTLP